MITNYTYNQLNQLKQSVENSITTHYDYDLIGNLIQTLNPTQSVIYEYNFLNKVSSITKTGVENLSLTFEYNSAGNRINKTYSDEKTFNYVYDGINVLKEESSIYNAPAYYLSAGIDQLFARTINNNTEFLIKDAINSLRMVIDNTQGITQLIDYKPFGGVLSGDAGNHHYLYTGREKDFGDSYYYRNRTYSTTTGTFQQKDPIGILGGLNLYSYVKNNPVNYMDPFGLAADNNSKDTTVWVKYEDPDKDGKEGEWLTPGENFTKDQDGIIFEDGSIFKNNDGVDIIINDGKPKYEGTVEFATIKDGTSNFAQDVLKWFNNEFNLTSEKDYSGWYKQGDGTKTGEWEIKQ